MEQVKEFTEKEQALVVFTASKIIQTLSVNRIPTFIGCSALIIAAARVAAHSDHDVDYIVEQFKACLLDARIQPQGNAS